MVTRILFSFFLFLSIYSLNGQVWTSSGNIAKTTKSLSIDTPTSDHSRIHLGHEANDVIFVDNTTTKHYGGGLFFRVHDETISGTSKYRNTLMLADNGNIGISVRQPKSKLHINGDLFMNAGEGFRLYGDTNYFGTHADGIIFEMQDVNGGNGNTDGGFVFKGHTPTDNISSEWMTIKSGGKVGIGVSAPTDKLEVKGVVKAYTTDSSKNIRVYGGNSANIIDSNNNDLYLRADGNSTKSIVLKKNGNVGIGEASPKGKLHVKGDIYTNAGEGFRLYGDTNYFGTHADGIIFEMQDANGGNGNTDGGFVFKGHTPTDNVSSEWMTIKSGGKVGIGTSDPKNKLSVNGTIWAKEIKVRLTDAADWVFKDSYNLRSLTELENYIKENKHLPEIPSAKEFEKNDMEVSKMTNKLLQKIEELSLYVIELNKQNKKLSKRLNELEK